jgi:hypothetical protein
MFMSPVGPGTKNDCAGEDQQQFYRTDPSEQQLPYKLSPYYIIKFSNSREIL